MSKAEPSLLDRPLPFRPWTCFWVFLVPLTLLSYFPLSALTRSWVAVLGLALPFGIALWIARSDPPPKRRTVVQDPTLPAWSWVPFLVLLVFSRLYHLTEAPAWPHADEAAFSVIALDLRQQWSWSLLVGENQWEPLYSWLLSWSFGGSSSSLLTMRLFPSLLSILSIAACYWAVHRIWGGFQAFLAASLMAFSFWPFLYGRLNTLHGLFILWEFLALGAWALLARGRGSLPGILLLGTILGSGFYVFTAWPLVALILGGLGVHALTQRHPPDRAWKRSLLLGLITGLVALPMIVTRLASGGMAHIQSFLQTSTLGSQGAKYLVSILWDGFGSPPWGPAWGGFLNPILGSLALLGILVIVRRSSRWAVGGMALVFILLFLPAAMAAAFSPHRIVGALPAALLCVLSGLRSLLPERPSRRALGILPLLLIPSFLLDARHFFGPFTRTIAYSDHAKTFPTVRTLAERSGPLYLFSEFSQDYDDRTLAVACRPFDALQRPELRQSDPAFCVVLVKVDYAPYLRSRFPRMTFKELPSDRDPAQRLRMGLFLIPTQDLGPSLLQAWIGSDKVCREVHTRIKSKHPWESWGRFTGMLLSSREAFQGDPFLRTVLWEKVALFHYLDGNYQEALRAYGQALGVGLRVPHLENNYTACLRLIGREGKSGGSPKEGKTVKEGSR